MNNNNNTDSSPFAIVTGGSSGIGLSISKELAGKGYNLLIISNQQEQLETARQEIVQQFNVQCDALTIDLIASDSAKEIFDYCQEHHLSVDVLVNNAGMLIFSEVIQTPTRRIDAILQLHIYTPTMLCRLFGEKMAKRKSGYILNISSISSVMPYPGISLYGPSKTYVRSFSRAFRHEMKIHGVNVSTVFPGATETGLYDSTKINLKLAKRIGIMQTPEFVAKKSIRGMFRKKSMIIPGIINKIAVYFLPILPTWFIFLLHKYTNLTRKGKEALD